MSNIIQFPPNQEQLEKARKEASQWLAKLDAGANEQDQIKLGQWMSEDPLHAQTLIEMADLWDQMDMLSELSTVFPLDQYITNPSPVTSTIPRRGLIAAGVAAIFTALIFIPLNLNTLVNGQNNGADSNLTHYTYQTTIGQQLNIDLPDGSEITLNTNTQIDVSYTDKQRNITLRQGEALFDVEKDSNRPFRVYAGDRMVEAVGTSFTVQRTSLEDVEVIVREGKVNFFQVMNSNGETIQDSALTLPQNVPLIAGDYAISANNSVQKTTIHPEQLEAHLAWQHGMLLFQGEPLEEVLEEIQRYTAIKIEAENEVKSIKVEGYFRADDIDGLLVAIQNNFKIDAHYLNPEHIILTPN